MIRVYSEQLDVYLEKNSFRYRCYILAGKDPFLLKESEEIIRKHARKLGFYEYCNIIFNIKTDLNELLNNVKKQSLFATKRILKLILSDKKQFSSLWEEKLFSVIELDLNIILIIIITKPPNWFALLNLSVLVDCSTPKISHFPKWICKRAEKIGLKIEKDALKWICYNYERNLLALVQILEILALFFSDGIITLSRIQNIVNDMAHFNHFHWLEAVFTGDSDRAFHILRQLRKQGNEISSLCYVLQIHLMTILQLKMSTTPLKIIFDQYQIIYNNTRQLLFNKALQRLNTNQIQKSLCLLAEIEVSLKESHEERSLLWLRLENLSLLLSCPKKVECSNK
ncbi:MAG: DNA polymerase III subunit delta [Candidatus Dasytiphilus stammeri]